MLGSTRAFRSLGLKISFHMKSCGSMAGTWTGGGGGGGGGQGLGRTEEMGRVAHLQRQQGMKGSGRGRRGGSSSGQHQVHQQGVRIRRGAKVVERGRMGSEQRGPEAFRRRRTRVQQTHVLQQLLLRVVVLLEGGRRREAQGIGEVSDLRGGAAPGHTAA